MEEQTPNLEVIRSEAKKAEKDRVAAINALGAQHRMADLAQELIDGDNSVDEARAAFLEKLGTRQVEQPIRSADVTSNDVGLSQKEVKRFSFVRALNYLANLAINLLVVKPSLRLKSAKLLLSSTSVLPTASWCLTRCCVVT